MAEPTFQPSVFDRLLKERIIWLGSEVRDDNSNEIAAKPRLNTVLRVRVGHQGRTGHQPAPASTAVLDPKATVFSDPGNAVPDAPPGQAY